MSGFDPYAYGPVFAPLVATNRRRALDDGTPDESARLAPDATPAPHTSPTPSRIRRHDPGTETEVESDANDGEPGGGGVRARAVGLLRRSGLESAARQARRRLQAATRDRHLLPLVVHPAPGSVLLEMDTVWNNLWVDRATLLTDLRAQGVHVAVLVYDLEAKKPVYELGADELLNPASNMKLLTTVAALARLGPDFRYPTEIYVASEPVGGVVQGDIYLRGKGDPSLDTERLYRIVRQLRGVAHGMARVEPLHDLGLERLDDQQVHASGWGRCAKTAKASCQNGSETTRGL